MIKPFAEQAVFDELQKQAAAAAAAEAAAAAVAAAAASEDKPQQGAWCYGGNYCIRRIIYNFIRQKENWQQVNIRKYKKY